MKEHIRAEFSISCLTCNSHCICSQVMMSLPTSPLGPFLQYNSALQTWPLLIAELLSNSHPLPHAKPYEISRSKIARTSRPHMLKKVSSLRARDKMCLQAGVSPRSTWPLTLKVESVAFACSSTDCIFRLGYVFPRIDSQVRLGIRHVL